MDYTTHLARSGHIARPRGSVLLDLLNIDRIRLQVAMAPVKVFGMAMSGNVARVLVCLEEVGVEYELVNMDFGAGEHKNPEHLISKKNPEHLARNVIIRSFGSPVQLLQLFGTAYAISIFCFQII